MKLVCLLYIPTNLSKAKSGTKSLKKWDFWSKSGTFSKLCQNWPKLSSLESK